MNNYKVWLEISKKAIAHNIKVFRRLISPKTELWAVVKSNAYGHGLVLFSQLADQYGVNGFCVDSVIEGVKLRENGIKKPVLVLGPTLPHLYIAAFKHGLTVTISNTDALKNWLKSKEKPNFHLKIDTGMHRQGFYPEELSSVFKKIKDSPLRQGFEGQVRLKIKEQLKGIYSHFASAKDINYPTFSERQFTEFQKAVSILEKGGFKNLERHIAATGGVLINHKYHLDMVRIGIGLYGLWPSRELREQLGNKINLKPVLSWYALISEIKKIRKGDYVGYDLTERVKQDGKIAIVPIGYWHGLPRALSSAGEVWLGSQKAKILGRVSMDLIAIDVSRVKCKVGDKVAVAPMEIAQQLGVSHYEIITRINPLIKKIIK